MICEKSDKQRTTIIPTVSRMTTEQACDIIGTVSSIVEKTRNLTTGCTNDLWASFSFLAEKDLVPARATSIMPYILGMNSDSYNISWI